MPEPGYIVFCDVDETLIHSKSMFDFLEFYLTERDGTAGAAQYRAIRHSLQLAADLGVPRDDINRRYYEHFAGHRADAVAAAGRRWFETRTTQGEFYITSTRDRLRRHQQDGALIVLVSGSFPAPLDPIAEDVGADRLLCTAPIVADGDHTGEIAESVIGSGKQVAASRLLAEYPGVDPMRCFGYGDHPSDIPMLDLIGNPVMVGQNRQLKDYLLARQPGERAPVVG